MYRIEYKADWGNKYHVYKDDEHITFFATLWGAKRAIKKMQKQELKVDEFNKGLER